MDPHAVLGISAAASPREVAEAYRALAKRWHPDRAGASGEARMVQINAAYEVLRGGVVCVPAAERTTARPRAMAGAWLDEATRRSLGRELLQALEREEAIALVVRAATWASPDTVLTVTDRRLLWLLDDAVTNRVRSVRFRDVERVGHRPAWPRRRDRASVRVQPRYGRRWEFTDLDPVTAERIVVATRRGNA